ncbi:MAG: hypothetical protein PWP64_643 [Candidatus Cloacimonadota bacterium]|nr:hypothetical protein [Candidatus Cloacimonadota bacterium]
MGYGLWVMGYGLSVIRYPLALSADGTKPSKPSQPSQRNFQFSRLNSPEYHRDGISDSVIRYA